VRKKQKQTQTALWIQTQEGHMRKLTITAPDNQARLVKLASGEWYIQWYANEMRFRQKFGLNRIKDLTERQRQADVIIQQINATGAAVRTAPVALTTAVILPQTKPTQPTFNEFVNCHVESRKMLRSPKTLTAISGHRDRVNEFAVEILGKAAMDWDGFNADFLIRYLDWAYSQKKWSKNYACKSVKTLKGILKSARKKKFTEVDIETEEYPLVYLPTDHIALDTGDLEKLLVAELDGLLSDVRAIFLFACLTGLRFSDFSRLTPRHFGNIKGKNGELIPIVKVFAEKTDEKVIVPLNTIAQSIVKRYGGKLPDVPCNQVFNRYIKSACALAGVTQKIVLQKNVAGKAIEKWLPKFKAVSAHTARRTFATIAYREWEMPTVLIMKITGHRTETEFFKYLKIGKEEAAIDMANYIT
jgi:integrase